MGVWLSLLLLTLGGFEGEEPLGAAGPCDYPIIPKYYSLPTRWRHPCHLLLKSSWGKGALQEGGPSLFGLSENERGPSYHCRLMRLLRPQTHLRRRQLLLGLPQLLFPWWRREHLRIQGSYAVPLRIPGELDLRYRYYFDVVSAPLVRRQLGFLLSLTSLSLGEWWLELLKEEAAAFHRLLVISVPSDELFQLSDLLAIHLLLSFILILKRT